MERHCRLNCTLLVFLFRTSLLSLQMSNGSKLPISAQPYLIFFVSASAYPAHVQCQFRKDVVGVEGRLCLYSLLVSYCSNAPTKAPMHLEDDTVYGFVFNTRGQWKGYTALSYYDHRPTKRLASGKSFKSNDQAKARQTSSL